MRHDPRIRQNLDRISTSLESAADNARTSCFTFTKSYLEPCLSSLVDCCTSCLPKARVVHHHHHHRNRYARRSEYPFGFYEYDDYDSDEDNAGHGFLAWGTDELDRLLAGSGSGTPARGERMFYGAVGEPSAGLRWKGTLPGRDSPDPTVIPGTSMFGFLSRFGVRGKGMRYKPSVANLQEHPQRSGAAAGVVLAGSSASATHVNGRKRSGTGSSAGSQGDSLRSRGDLWPSEDEDDAVVIGDDAFPRSSDGESAEVLGLGIGSDDDCAREEDLLVEDIDQEEWRRMGEHSRRLAMQRGPSSDSTEETKARNFSRGSNSAPPTILAASPDQYPTGLGILPFRPSSVKSREGSIDQQIHRPLPPRARKEKGAETNSDTTSAPRPQMRQVPLVHSPMPPTSPSLVDIESTLRMGERANDDIYDADDNE